MYGYLLLYLPPRVAQIVLAAWFVALIVGVIMCSVEPPAEFNYGDY